MCLPACLWAQTTRTPFQYTITARTLPAICDAVNFRYRFFRFQLWEKLCYRKEVHHNPIITYATRCLEKRKWLHVLWDKLFPEVRTNREESMKTWRWKVPWLNNSLPPQWNYFHFTCELVCISHLRSVVPKSYKLEVRPKSTSDEFLSRVIGNCRIFNK